MKRIPGISNIDGQLVGLLLVPSGLSTIVAASLSIVFTTSVIALSRYQASSIRLDFLSYQATQLLQSYQHVNNGLAANTFIGNLPLLTFWSLVGFVVYLFVANIFAAIRNTAELKNELEYVHADRQAMLWTAAEHLAIRLAVLIVWTGYILFFFHHILPYCLAAALTASAHFTFIQSAGYALLSVALMAVAIQVHTVMLRLLLLRPRLFSKTLYIT